MAQELDRRTAALASRRACPPALPSDRSPPFRSITAPVVRRRRRTAASTSSARSLLHRRKSALRPTCGSRPPVIALSLNVGLSRLPRMRRCIAACRQSAQTSGNSWTSASTALPVASQRHAPRLPYKTSARPCPPKPVYACNLAGRGHDRFCLPRRYCL